MFTSLQRWWHVWNDLSSKPRPILAWLRSDLHIHELKGTFFGIHLPSMNFASKSGQRKSGGLVVTLFLGTQCTQHFHVLWSYIMFFPDCFHRVNPLSTLEWTAESVFHKVSPAFFSESVLRPSVHPAAPYNLTTLVPLMVLRDKAMCFILWS